MQKNKVTTYLLYALGEIVLVVIGILIALEVNNRNEIRKNHDLELKYLKEIRDNLTFDLRDNEFNINFNKARLQSNQAVLAYLKGESVDSLEFHLGQLVFSTRTLVNPSGYESLKSKGLELITNDALRSQLTTLYEFNIHNVVDFETKDDLAFQYNILHPEIKRTINIDYSDNRVIESPSGIGHLIDPATARQNEELKSAISTNLLYRKLMVQNYQELQANMQSTINMIEDELKVLSDN